MERSQLLNAAAAGLMVVALAACNDATIPALVDDQQLTQDVAATSGDAIATEVGTLLGNEVNAALPGPRPSFSLFGDPADLVVNRTRTCYDGTQVQTQCDPITTDSVVLTLTIDGSFTRQHTGPRGTETMTRAVHQARRHVISGLDGQETSRTHNGAGAGNDTTQFTATANEGGASHSRTVTESSLDSVQNIVFNLPHATNPWPVSGSIVRRVTGQVTATSGDRTETRSFSLRVSVTFPADNQGNVTIQINERTCTLNLVTRTITNCS